MIDTLRSRKAFNHVNKLKELQKCLSNKQILFRACFDTVCKTYNGI